jgi:hypothetical protein
VILPSRANPAGRAKPIVRAPNRRSGDQGQLHRNRQDRRVLDRNSFIDEAVAITKTNATISAPRAPRYSSSVRIKAYCNRLLSRFASALMVRIVIPRDVPKISMHKQR